MPTNAKTHTDDSFSVYLHGKARIKPFFDTSGGSRVFIVTFNTSASPSSLADRGMMIFWDRKNVGDPSLYKILKEGVLSRPAVDTLVGGCRSTLEEYKTNVDGQFAEWFGIKSATFGPQGVFVQFEVFSESDPKLLTMVKLGFLSTEQDMEFRLQSVLKSIRVGAPNDWHC